MSAPRRWDLLTVGDIFADLVLSGFAAWPRPGEEAYAERMGRDVGGGVAITAAGAARLGLRAASLACVGADDGDFVARRLRALGVDDAALSTVDDEPTATTVSVSLSDDRAMFTYAGANKALPARLAGEKLPTLLAQARHVHLACALPAAALRRIARQARDAGCTTSVDAGWHPTWLRDAEVVDALREVGLLLPNEVEAQQLSGCSDVDEILTALAGLGLRAVALKLGAAGAALLWEGEVLRAEPFSVEPLDTTGAGDAFDAGFLAAQLCGAEPDQCLRCGAAVGALSTRALGGVAALPSRAELAAVAPGALPPAHGGSR